MIRNSILSAIVVLGSTQVVAEVQSKITPYSETLENDQVVLKNDSFQEAGGQAYLQMGFVANEMAGVWVQVPATYDYFKIEYFRVLIGNSAEESVAVAPTPELFQNVFFQMGIANETSSAIPRQIENAASITPGPYWNDIPAIGEPNQLGCARGGQFIGAAVEFTHTGLPSVFRDLDGINVKNNVLYAVPGGWNYSAAYGLRGDWILRVVGRKASPSECGA